MVRNELHSLISIRFQDRAEDLNASSSSLVLIFSIHIGHIFSNLFCFFLTNVRHVTDKTSIFASVSHHTSWFRVVSNSWLRHLLSPPSFFMYTSSLYHFNYFIFIRMLVDQKPISGIWGRNTPHPFSVITVN